SPVELTDTTGLFILDSNGVVISSKDKSKVPINTAYANQEVVEKIKEQVEKLESEQNVEGESRDIKGTFVTDIGEEGYLISFSRIKDTNWFITGTIPMSYLTEDSNSILSNMFKVGFVIFVLAVLVSLIISFSILSPLTSLESLMKKVRSGNLSISIKDKFHDEISALSNDFGSMVETIRFLVSKVNISSNQVLKTAGDVNELSSTYQISAEQIGESMMQIAAGASEQAINSVKTVDYVNELSDDINRVEKEMKQAAQIIQDTKELSKNALVAVKSLNEKSIQTGEVTDDIVKSINSLNIDMKEIEKVIKFIGSISDQTNLLSLNAAIEAARAGEAGRGFAVVADHIGKLAEQTNESLKTISNVIENILKKTEVTVKSADNTQNIIKQQMKAVGETDNSFKEIFKSMEDIGILMNSFEASVNMIMASRQKTLDAINDISAVSEQTAATVEEVSATAQNQINDIEQLANQAKLLKNMAQELNSAISTFTV
ncbi:MAG: methyl-accepting chemotaxis protein, partial [Clostridiaceae bacterium]|nr:methyl-accepting chemotaxis protein [Clostridiaceae bacterium]